MADMIELRCPEHGKMFGRISAEPGSDTLFEVSCRTCRADRDPSVRMVLHVFNGDGVCVMTLAQRKDARR